MNTTWVKATQSYNTILPSYKGIIPLMNRSPIKGDNNDDHYEALVERQINTDKN